jgi:hypothetical protein
LEFLMTICMVFTQSYMNWECVLLYMTV